MKKLKSKIVYNPIDLKAYDGLPTNRITSDEFGQWQELPKDYVNYKKLGVINSKGEVNPLLFAKTKKKKP